jgi:hypothetical protein
MEALMACPVIEVDLMEIFRARPAEWQDGPAFRPVIARHAVGFGLGYKLYSMARHLAARGQRLFTLVAASTPSAQDRRITKGLNKG